MPQTRSTANKTTSKAPYSAKLLIFQGWTITKHSHISWLWHHLPRACSLQLQWVRSTITICSFNLFDPVFKILSSTSLSVSWGPSALSESSVWKISSLIWGKIKIQSNFVQIPMVFFCMSIFSCYECLFTFDCLGLILPVQTFLVFIL